VILSIYKWIIDKYCLDWFYLSSWTFIWKYIILFDFSLLYVLYIMIFILIKIFHSYKQFNLEFKLKSLKIITNIKLFISIVLLSFRDEVNHFSIFMRRITESLKRLSECSILNLTIFTHWTFLSLFPNTADKPVIAELVIA
jgi:hypothetical protein